MTEEEALKINELYKQIDTLTAENETLKETGTQHSDQHTAILDRLDSLETLLKEVSCKCGTSSKTSCAS